MVLGEHDLNGFFRKQIREAVREVAAQAVKDAMKELALATQGEKDVFNAKEAAEFLRISYESFKRFAPEVDRIAISEHRYVYLREDLLAWLESRKREGG